MKRYNREAKYNRGTDDIRRQMLNCLVATGPTPITQLLFRIALSYGQAKVHLGELIGVGLVSRKPLSKMIQELSKEQLGKLAEMSDNVTDLYMITGKGQKYLEKLNEMELMIKWGKEALTSTY